MAMQFGISLSSILILFGAAVQFLQIAIMRMPLVSKNLTKYSSLDSPSEKANSTHSELDSATHDQDSSSVSDCKSSISGPYNDLLPSFYDWLIRLQEGDRVLISLDEDWFRVWVWWVEHKLRLLPFIGIHFVVSWDKLEHNLFKSLRRQWPTNVGAFRIRNLLGLLARNRSFARLWNRVLGSLMTMDCTVVAYFSPDDSAMEWIRL